MKKILSFFNSKSSPVTNTTAVIEEIHNAFNNEGDRLLKQANELLNSLTVNNKDKSRALQEFGFTQTKEVSAMKQVESQRQEQEKIAKAITEAKKEYPLYRFITKASAKRIATKYNLVLGLVSQYKGFVPQKNLTEIAKFFENHPNDKKQYLEVRSSWGSKPTVITKEVYERGQAKRERDISFTAYISHYEPHYTTRPTVLNICAPISDMDTEGYEKKGWELVKKEIPDPIVMLEKKYNGVDGFIIITAWGDEASDPEVINHSNN